MNHKAFKINFATIWFLCLLSVSPPSSAENGFFDWIVGYDWRYGFDDSERELRGDKNIIQGDVISPFVILTADSFKDRSFSLSRPERLLSCKYKIKISWVDSNEKQEKEIITEIKRIGDSLFSSYVDLDGNLKQEIVRLYNETSDTDLYLADDLSRRRVPWFNIKIIYRSLLLKVKRGTYVIKVSDVVCGEFRPARVQSREMQFEVNPNPVLYNTRVIIWGEDFKQFRKRLDGSREWALKEPARIIIAYDSPNQKYLLNANIMEENFVKYVFEPFFSQISVPTVQYSNGWLNNDFLAPQRGDEYLLISISSRAVAPVNRSILLEMSLEEFQAKIKQGADAHRQRIDELRRERIAIDAKNQQLAQKRLSDVSIIDDGYFLIRIDSRFYTEKFGRLVKGTCLVRNRYADDSLKQELLGVYERQQGYKDWSNQAAVGGDKIFVSNAEDAYINLTTGRCAAIFLSTIDGRLLLAGLEREKVPFQIFDVGLADTLITDASALNGFLSSKDYVLSRSFSPVLSPRSINVLRGLGLDTEAKIRQKHDELLSLGYVGDMSDTLIATYVRDKAEADRRTVNVRDILKERKEKIARAAAEAATVAAAKRRKEEREYSEKKNLCEPLVRRAYLECNAAGANYTQRKNCVLLKIDDNRYCAGFF